MSVARRSRGSASGRQQNAGHSSADGWDALFSASLTDVGGAVADCIRNDADRERRSINLIASASYAPLALRQAEGSHLVNKNASGWVGRRSVANCEEADAIEQLAIDRARAVFGGEAVNVQALSSTLANVAVFRALLKRGDRLLAFGETAGGHLSHGTPGHLSSSGLEVHTFGVDSSDMLDLDEARHLARKLRPSMIVAGATSYPRRVDFAGLRQIADEVGALLFSDIAHVAGLIATGLHPNPVPFSDVATSSTQKTLCGPRNGAFTFSRQAHGQAIDRAIYPGMQGPAPVHLIAARAIQLDLVRRPEFKALMTAVVENARALCSGLQAEDVRLYTGGSETHMVVADLRRTEWDANSLVATFAKYGIVANAIGLPRRSDDSSGSGLRFGTTAMSIRGLDAAGFHAIGVLIGQALRRGPKASIDSGDRERLRDIALAHPIPSFVS